MIKNKYHIILLSCAFLALAACSKKQSKLPDLRESFAYTDTKPFGSSVAYSMLQNAYPTSTVSINKKDIGENYDWAYENNAIYFSISKNYYPAERDITALLEFAYKGNTAFISANKFDDELLNKLYTKNNSSSQTLIRYPMQQTTTAIIPELSLYADSASYFYYPFTNNFSELHNKYGRMVGINANGNTNLFVFFWGKGRIYLHAEPRAFSNYFLLTKDNYLYMKQILQMLPAKDINSTTQNIFWDNFYTKRNFPKTKKDDSASTLSEIFKHPPLKAAFWIFLSLLILFILFGMKRKQRMIPVVKLAENNSIAFAETIARLYLNKKDNKVIADKIITYYNEQIRTKYFINLQASEVGYADAVSRKAGVAIETTQKLTNTIIEINRSVKVSDVQLLMLNGLIEQFFKK